MKRPLDSRETATEAQALAEDAAALASLTLAKLAGALLGEAQSLATAGDLLKRGDFVRATGQLRTTVDKLRKLQLALGGDQ